MVFSFLIYVSFELTSYLTFNKTPSLAILKALPNIRILKTFSYIKLIEIVVFKVQIFIHCNNF